MYDEIFFTFSSTQHAISGEQVLLAEKIDVKIMPLHNTIKAGCGLCLRVRESEISKIKVVFDNKGIVFEKVYKEIKKHEYIEVVV